MFLNSQNPENLAYYKRMLEVVGSLSNLFADSSAPYLNYRTTENLFCRAFEARNLSRSDIAIDACKESTGVGIKTFLLKNNNSFEKVAEFNRKSILLRGASTEQIIQKVVELRNERLDVAKRISDTSNLIYHCITRTNGKIYVYETPMDFIDINAIKGIKTSDSGIKFTDGKNDYGFNFSKSTLFKRFHSEKNFIDINVQIIEDPLSVLEEYFGIEKKGLQFVQINTTKEHVYLPLYSSRINEKGKRTVEEKSGLNQWNASGRPRDPNEIYIPIPIWLYRRFPSFFPPRDVNFDLVLPSGEILSAKVCQDNSKALMTNPNKALGKWLLRDVLNLPERELLTYEKLEKIGLDSVVISKEKEGLYTINFTKINSYENFKQGSLSQ